MPSDTRGVLVSCRLRAPSQAELSVSGYHDAAAALHVGPAPNSVSVTVGASHAFQFDHVFPPSASQQEVFSAVGAPCVRDLLLGYNCTLLAYGQTGSGKTHTTIGGIGPDSDGLVPRMLELLFASVAQEPDTTLTASFVEVYQERLRDLLLPSTSSTAASLRIRDDKTGGGGVWVDGASEIALPDLATARAAVQRGLRHRAVGATQMNRDSSRSHAVFAVTVSRRDPTASATRLRARLCVVDLAGSEQAKKTRASGTRLDEAKHINRSLSALGNVIHALTGGSSSAGAVTKASYVPYRDSKLTRLLQSSLGGNAKTHLLLTCATAGCHADESLSTLRFGARAKHMQNSPTVNVNVGASGQGGAVLETLQRKIESLCRYVRELEDAASRCHCGVAAASSGSEAAVIETGESPTEEEDEPASETVAPTDDDRSCHSAESPCSSDLVMRAELRTLRLALNEMRRREMLQDTTVQDAMSSIERSETEKLNVQQAREIERLEQQLTAAECEVAALQTELRAQRETQAELMRQLSQLESALRRDETAAAAESEILRRRLDQSERLTRNVQLELSASRAETADLRLEVHRSEQERVRIRGELDAALQQLQTAVGTASASTQAPASPVSSPVRSKTTKPTLLRPVTVTTGSSGAIQSWWAGGTNNCEEEQEVEHHDDGRADVRRSHALVEPENAHEKCRLPNGAARTSRCSTSVGRPRLDPVDDADDGDQSPLHQGHVAASRTQQLHTSGGTRPFRTRLVGLLNSLEAETSSYKELLLDGGTSVTTIPPSDDSAAARPRASHARSHTRRHRLPELALPPMATQEEDAPT